MTDTETPELVTPQQLRRYAAEKQIVIGSRGRVSKQVTDILRTVYADDVKRSPDVYRKFSDAA